MMLGTLDSIFSRYFLVLQIYQRLDMKNTAGFSKPAALEGT